MRHASAFVAECQQQIAAGRTREQIVAFLLEQGCSKLNSIAVIASAFEIGLAEAKKLVHLSEAWSDVRERDDRFHAALESAFTMTEKKSTDSPADGN